NRVPMPQNEEGVALVIAQLAVILAQAPAKGRARQLIARPLRLPNGQMLAAHGPELGPGGIIAHRRMAQEHLLAVDLCLGLDSRRRSQERHRFPRTRRPPSRWWMRN